MATTYEWTVEELDWYEGCGDDPDIIDPHFFDTLAEAIKFAATVDATDGPQPPCRIGLMRRVGNDRDGETDRSYAYLVNDGMAYALPARFEYLQGAQDGPDVPKRFLAETDKLNKTGQQS